MEKWSQNIGKHSFQALPESTNDHYKIIINEWSDSSDKHWLTICTVTCFTATMRRLHAYYATLQYRSQSFISKSASHAYHKLNTCKILATLNVHEIDWRQFYLFVIYSVNHLFHFVEN